jgi:hypothetical protein
VTHLRQEDESISDLLLERLRLAAVGLMSPSAHLVRRAACRRPVFCFCVGGDGTRRFQENCRHFSGLPAVSGAAAVATNVMTASAIR